MCAPSPPPAPDYAGAARETAAGDIEAARYATVANRPDIYTPQGQQLWEQSTEDPDRWTGTTALTPEGQAAFESGQRLQTGLAGLGEQAVGQVGDLFSTRYEGPQEAVAPFGENRQRVMEAMLSRVETDIGRERENTHAKLIAQGIPPNSDAYNRTMEQLDRKQTDARQQAEIAATGQALAEQTGGLDVRRQGIQEALLERQTPLSEISAFRTGSQVALPQFQAYGQQRTTGGPDILGATTAQGQYDLGTYNQQAAQAGGLTKGLFGLGAAAIGAPPGTFSDIRLKHNIKEISHLPSGIPVYEFNYLWSDEKEIGVMAQEVLPVIPEAVTTHNGYLAVDYRMLH